MELELDGKVAIVTGGSKGIGRATALGFVNEGASVLVCARGREALDETIAAAGHGGRERIEALAADLTILTPSNVWWRAAPNASAMSISW